MSKGSGRRPGDEDKYRSNHDRIFGLTTKRQVEVAFQERLSRENKKTTVRSEVGERVVSEMQALDLHRLNSTFLPKLEVMFPYTLENDDDTEATGRQSEECIRSEEAPVGQDPPSGPDSHGGGDGAGGGEVRGVQLED